MNMSPAYQPAGHTLAPGEPDVVVSARELFKIDTNLQVPAFSAPEEHVPPLDPDYVFDRDTTLALLAGFVHNRRVMVQGRHGTGKSSHVEQVASRLNWPCVRVNLDGHVSRMDLIGKDAIVVRDGKQVTEFQPGMLTWALQRPCALVFDEYDAGRADVMFVIQRVLEVEGRLTLLDQSRVIEPHPSFRLFATANTVGLGDASGLYHGTQPLNQGQMDRWNIVVTLNYLEHDREIDVVLARCPEYRTVEGRARVSAMVALANLTRRGFADGDLSTLMSPRTVVTWAQNTTLFHDPALAFKLTFLNRCDEDERALVARTISDASVTTFPTIGAGPVSNELAKDVASTPTSNSQRICLQGPISNHEGRKPRSSRSGQTAESRKHGGIHLGAAIRPPRYPSEAKSRRRGASASVVNRFRVLRVLRELHG